MPEQRNGDQQTVDVVLAPDDQVRLAKLCGQFDANIRQIEQRLGLRIASRGNHFELTGDGNDAQVGAAVLEDLYAATATDEIDAQRVREIIELLRQRLGERFRPELELDYIERLLRRF